MAIEKLRGFVADHQAHVVKIDDAEVQLEIREKCTSLLRRLTDRPVVFQVHLHFEEQHVGQEAGSGQVGRPGRSAPRSTSASASAATATAAATTC